MYYLIEKTAAPNRSIPFQLRYRAEQAYCYLFVFIHGLYCGFASFSFFLSGSSFLNPSALPTGTANAALSEILHSNARTAAYGVQEDITNRNTLDRSG